MQNSSFLLEKTEGAAPDHRAAVLAGFLGWTLDAFDFFLVAICLTDIGREFGQSDTRMALSITVTLAFRPIGAFLFGMMADRYGRRLPLMLDLIFYSLVEVLTGFTRSFRTFLILRALFGIGMGGEWGVGASLAMEKVPPKWRGILSGLLQEGYAAGYLLAALAYRLVFPYFGWRPLFFIGGIPALLALFVRFGVKESEVWERTRHATFGEWDGILSHWKLFIYLVILMAMMNFSSHGTQDMYPTFLKRDWHFSASNKASLTAFMMSGAIVGGICFGLLSDRIGRRRAMIAAFIGAIVLIPLWAFAPNLPMLVAGAFLMQFMIQGAWGVIPAHITELSPDSVRGFLPGFAYQCGVLIAGTVGWFEAKLAEQMTYAKAMGLLTLIIFCAAIFVVGLGKEKRAIRFGQ